MEGSGRPSTSTESHAVVPPVGVKVRKGEGEAEGEVQGEVEIEG